ncbi:MAG: class I SAM-dependent methyltransferase [Proteobacteria bacterium]|nr:class I SAM-dependent methyltransferase [Pseudomonadota bacterium]MBU1687479.1 class I SAM-dependent methyltransferase [Pseudomonadota bacterium]
MKNQENWQPGKYVYRKGKLVASRDTNEIRCGSRLVADLVAGLYDTALRRHAKGRLLDLGCGKVPLYLVYRDLVTENICVDWENTQHTNDYLDYECDLTRELPFADGSFDTIILSDVLEHIPQPEILWREMARLLAPGGKIVMNVPFFYWLHERPHDYYRYTEFALRRFVELSGLSLVQLESVGGSPEILADMLAKHIQFIPAVGKPTAVFIQYLAQLFVKTSPGKKISKKTSEGYPFGYFLVVEKP